MMNRILKDAVFIGVLLILPALVGAYIKPLWLDLLIGLSIGIFTGFFWKEW